MKKSITSAAARLKNREMDPYLEIRNSGNDTVIISTTKYSAETNSDMAKHCLPAFAQASANSVPQRTPVYPSLAH